MIFRDIFKAFKHSFVMCGIFVPILTEKKLETNLNFSEYLLKVWHLHIFVSNMSQKKPSINKKLNKSLMFQHIFLTVHPVQSCHGSIWVCENTVFRIELSWSTPTPTPQTLYPSGQIIFSCTRIQSWARDNVASFATTTTLHCVKVSVT